MSNILFVFEGERTEKQISDNLTRYFVNENTVVQCAYCNNIYKLHKEISNDNDLDTFLLLKELPSNREVLSQFSSDDFAEIYMFFDYDGHDTSADDQKIKEALKFFNEETNSGKLYISYPMVEALKHITINNDFKDLKVEAKSNINYKYLVSTQAKKELIDFRHYTKDTWLMLIDLHLRKMNYITNGSYTLPLGIIPQNIIFSKQEEKYINIDSKVAILSSFPIFIFEYYGHEFIVNLLHDRE